MLVWLQCEQKTSFITIADEEAASRQIIELQWGGRPKRASAPVVSKPQPLGEEERFVAACLRVGRQRGVDPFRAAQMSRQWTRQQWDTAEASFHDAQHQRWSAGSA
ncbi:MAG: hypothetical protein AAF368_14995 [Planctomycetota bacterium]